MQSFWGGWVFPILILIHLVSGVRNAFSLHSHRMFLFSIHPFQHPQHPEHSCICLPSLPQIPSSLPHLLWGLTCLKSALLKVQHPPSLKKNTPVPACQPSGWKPSGLLWWVGELIPPRVCFPSIPPQGHGASLPPPNSFLFPRPGPSRTSNCQGSECHIPAASHHHMEGSRFLRGGRGQGKEAGVKSSPGANSSSLYSMLGTTPWGPEGNQGPQELLSQWTRTSFPTSVDEGGRQGHHYRLGGSF